MTGTTIAAMGGDLDVPDGGLGEVDVGRPGTVTVCGGSVTMSTEGPGALAVVATVHS